MIKDAEKFTVGEDGLVFKKINTNKYTKLARSLKIAVNYENQSNEISYLTKIDLTKVKLTHPLFQASSLELPSLSIDNPEVQSPYCDVHIDIEEVVHANDNPGISKTINGIRNRPTFLSNFNKWPKISTITINNESKFKI